MEKGTRSRVSARQEDEAPARESAYACLLLGVVTVAWVVAFFAIQHFVVAPGQPVLRWDSGWYLNVAQFGYHFDGNIARSQNVAFLPALPLLERAMLAIGLGAPLAVYVPVIGCALAGVALLYRALTARFAPLWSAAACALLIASPFSLYFLNGYSEPVYLACLGAFFWALWRRRDIALAALFAGLGSAVRPYGLVLVFVWSANVAIQAHREGRSARYIVQRLLAYGPLCVAGFVLTSLFFYWQFGDLLLYRNIMVSWYVDIIPSRANGFGDHLITVWRMMGTIDFAHGIPSTQLARIIFWSAPVVVACAARRLPLAATLYAALLFAFIVVVAETGADLGRHLSTNVALPFGLLAILWPPTEAQPTRWRATAIALAVIAAAAMQGWLAAGYFRGEWVS